MQHCPNYISGLDGPFACRLQSASLVNAAACLTTLLALVSFQSNLSGNWSSQISASKDAFFNAN